MAKLYYTIGEVSELLSLEQHVLRYWESEFSELRPQKNRAGNRVYKEKDIDLIKKIMFLLYEQQFTIEGAKKRLKQLKNISLDDYKKIELLLLDKDFFKEFKKIFGL